MRWSVWLVCLGLMLTAVLPLSFSAQKEIRRVDKETLKGWLGQPGVTIIDARTPRSWASSDRKIKGAVYQDPGEVATWGKTLPKDNKIVVYCS